MKEVKIAIYAHVITEEEPLRGENDTVVEVLKLNPIDRCYDECNQ